MGTLNRPKKNCFQKWPDWNLAGIWSARQEFPGFPPDQSDPDTMEIQFRHIFLKFSYPAQNTTSFKKNTTVFSFMETAKNLTWFLIRNSCWRKSFLNLAMKTFETRGGGGIPHNSSHSKILRIDISMDTHTCLHEKKSGKYTICK